MATDGKDRKVYVEVPERDLVVMGAHPAQGAAVHIHGGQDRNGQVMLNLEDAKSVVDGLLEWIEDTEGVGWGPATRT